MAIKRYEVYVVMDLVEGFEERLNMEDKVKLYSREPAISNIGEPLIHYVIEAEEGLINSKWELE